MTARQIPLVYPCKCRKCGKQLLKHQQAWYKKDFGCRCLECGEHDGTDKPTRHKADGPSPATPRRRRPRRPQPGRYPPYTPPTPQPAPQPKADRDPKAPSTFAGVKSSAPAVRGSDGIYRTQFDSIGEAVANAFNWDGNTGCNDYTRSEINRDLRDRLQGHNRWLNYYTEEKFRAALVKCPQHLLDAVAELKDAITEEVFGGRHTAPRRRIRRGQEFGENIEVDRFLCRVPNIWERNVREHHPKQTVWIGCNLSIDGSCDWQDLVYRGAAALALADVMQERGYNVGIVGFNSRADITSQVQHGVDKLIVKQPNMPTDISSLTFALAEVAFFRLTLAEGTVRLMPGNVDWRLGRPMPLPDRDKAEIDYCIEHNVFSKEAAVEWLQSCMAQAESGVHHVA